MTYADLEVKWVTYSPRGYKHCNWPQQSFFLRPEDQLEHHSKITDDDILWLTTDCPLHI